MCSYRTWKLGSVFRPMSFVPCLGDKCGMIGILYITGTRDGGYDGLDVGSFARQSLPWNAFVYLFRSVGQRSARTSERYVQFIMIFPSISSYTKRPNQDLTPLMH